MSSQQDQNRFNFDFSKIKSSLRNGQRDAYRESSDKDVTQLRCEFPTGYGKTKAGCLAYIAKRQIGQCNKLAIIVPGLERKESYLKEIEDDFRSLGYSLPPSNFIVDGSSALAGKGLHEVYIYNNECLDSEYKLESLLKLLKLHNFALFLDEYHHLASDSSRGKRIAKAVEASVFAVYMSATPVRTDKNSTIAGSEIDIQITRKEALIEDAIRPIKVHAMEYQIDISFDNERDIHSVTLSQYEEELEQLRREHGKNMTDAQFRSKVRHHSKYISTVIPHVVNLYNRKERDYPGLNQIIVYAENCQHAQQLVNDFRKFGLDSDQVDWVGTGPNGRGSKENSDVLDRFLCRGAYKKLKTPTLKCLIQVQKAAEGFNCIRANILVFLNALGGDCVLIIQMLGRGARRCYKVDPCHPGRMTEIDLCDVICSSDSPILPLLKGIESDQGLDTLEQKVGRSSQDRESPILYSIPDIALLDVNHTGTDVFCSDGLEFRKHEILEELHNLHPDVSLDRIEKDLDKILTNRKQTGAGLHVIEEYVKSEHEQLTEIKHMLHSAIKQMAGNIVSLLYSSGEKVYQGAYGDVVRKINSHIFEVYGGWRDELTISQCKDAHAYIQRINNTFSRSRKAEDVPSWAKL